MPYTTLTPSPSPTPTPTPTPTQVRTAREAVRQLQDKSGAHYWCMVLHPTLTLALALARTTPNPDPDPSPNPNPDPNQVHGAARLSGRGE
eukprot:scaffold32599_cov32-Phaeocystis_antarctica.AAC.1